MPKTVGKLAPFAGTAAPNSPHDGTLWWDTDDGSGVAARVEAEMDYVERTTDVTLAGTTEAAATTIVTSSAVTYDGATDIFIEFFAALMTWQDNSNTRFWLYDGSSSIGEIGRTTVLPSGHTIQSPLLLRRKLTPSAGAHTYSIRGSSSGGTGVVAAGAGGAGAVVPAYIRITRRQTDAARASAGTAFPLAPVTGDRYFRTDKGQEFFWNGTRWLSTAVYEMAMPAVFDKSASWTDTFTSRAPAPNLRGGSDIWLTDCNLSGYHITAGGSALSVSHSWRIRLIYTNPGGAINDRGTFTIDSGASNVWRQGSPGPVAAIDSLMGTVAFWYLDGLKVGTPGNLSCVVSFTYRIVAV